MSKSVAMNTRVLALNLSSWVILAAFSAPAQAESQTVSCDVMIAGGGLGGLSAALESLKQGQRVCMTEMTDWVGGQITQQGVSALDERPSQRDISLFPKTYIEFRQRIANFYGTLNPGKCWVSNSCFAPKDGHQILRGMLEPYLKAQTPGTPPPLQLFPNTVVKRLQVEGAQIRSLEAITHIPKGQPNDQPLSNTLEDWYSAQPSAKFDKQVIRFTPPAERQNNKLAWMVLDGTETGELLPLAGVPYALGTDLGNRWEPAASAKGTDPYCTQGFTYTFIMEAADTPEANPVKPEGYDSDLGSGYYSYEKPTFDFAQIFTYRRIKGKLPGMKFESISIGDQTLQNWDRGNDWKLGTPDDNLVLTQEQLEKSGQLQDWRGGLRTAALKKGENHALGYFYWLQTGRSDPELQKLNPAYQKDLYLNYRFLKGADSPMGTLHGLSRHPYIREGRRLIGRPSISHPQGFSISETDISQRATDENRQRAYIFYDSVGVGHYPIDFHECIKPDTSLSPYEAEQAPSVTYPFQVPLRALIPQKVDNLLAVSKNIATTHITNGSYRVHPVEWSIGVAGGHTADFALKQGVFPYELVKDVGNSKALEALQKQIQDSGNPIAFPGTSIFNQDWKKFK
jgi:FAD dependent oxidoreductase